MCLTNRTATPWYHGSNICKGDHQFLSENVNFWNKEYPSKRLWKYSFIEEVFWETLVAGCLPLSCRRRVEHSMPTSSHGHLRLSQGAMVYSNQYNWEGSCPPYFLGDNYYILKVSFCLAIIVQRKKNNATIKSVSYKNVTILQKSVDSIHRYILSNTTGWTSQN